MGIPRIFQNDALPKEVQPVCSIVSVSVLQVTYSSSPLMVRELKKIHASDNNHQDSLERLIRLECMFTEQTHVHASLIQVLLSHLGLLFLGAGILAA